MKKCNKKNVITKFLKYATVFPMVLLLFLSGMIIKDITTENVDKSYAAVNWTVSNGTLEIYGSGAMSDYTSDTKPGWSNQSYSKVVIKSGITSIGACAFYNDTKVVDITIADTVTKIGREAFYECSNLTSFDGPKVTTVGSDCFYKCSSLKTVSLPMVTSIGENFFFQCTALETVSLPLVNMVGSRAFTDCSSLKEISLPSCSSIMGEQSFQGCTSLTSATFSSALTKIPNSTFSGCTSLESFPVDPAKITTIGGSAFMNCTLITGSYEFTNLESIGASAFYGSGISGVIKMPALTITKLENHTFNETNITELQIPNTVTTIADYTFYNCTSLESIPNANNLVSVGKCSFTGCTALSGTITLPNLTSISGESAFKGCNQVEEFSLPNITTMYGSAFMDCSGAKKISTPKITSFNSSVFSGCTSLETWPNDPTLITSVGTSAFKNCTSLSNPGEFTNLSTIKDNGFENCTGLTGTISFPSLTSLGTSAFLNCTGLTKITIPNTITSMPNSAFKGCSALESFPIDASLITKIGSSSFSGCTNLSFTGEFTKLTTIGSSGLSYCEGLTGTISLPSLTTTPENYSFDGCKNIKKVILPESNTFTTVSQYAFRNCSSLEEFPFNESKVTTINTHAFDGCSSMAVDLELSALTDSGLNTYMFANSGIKSITLPNGVTNIPNYSFKGCGDLKTVNASGAFTSIGIEAFKDCVSLEEFPELTNISSLNTDCFNGCIKLPLEVNTSNALMLSTGCLKDCYNVKSIAAGSINSDSLDVDALAQCKLLEKVSINTLGASTLKIPFAMKETTSGDIYDAGDTFATGEYIPYRELDDGNGTLTVVNDEFDFTGSDIPFSSENIVLTYNVYNVISEEEKVLLKSYVLAEGTDYTLEVTSPDKATPGTKTFTVTGLGMYANSLSGEFTITSADLADCTIVVTNTTYTGVKATPTVTVKINNSVIDASNYTVSCDDINAGEAIVTITANSDNYTGTNSETFTINPYAITPSTNGVVAASKEYDGTTSAENQTATIAGVNNEELKLTLSGTYESKDVATGLSITWKTISDGLTVTNGQMNAANYSYTAGETVGTTTGNSITPKEIKADLTSLESVTKTYDGNTKALWDSNDSKSCSTSGVDGETLNFTVTGVYEDASADTDKKVTYSLKSFDSVTGSNTNKDNYSFSLDGDKNFTLTNTISKRTITSSDFETIDTTSETYTGLEHTKTVTPVSDLTEDDYEVVITNNIDAGTATVTVNGKGNCDGTFSSNFTINPAEIKVDMSSVKVSKTYDKTNTAFFEEGNETPKKEFTIDGVNGEKIKYKVTGSYESINKGDDIKVTFALDTSSVTVEGGKADPDNYNFSLDTAKNYSTGNSINALAITENIFTISDLDTEAFTGSPITKDVTNSLGLAEDDDYEVEYENNVNAGTATLKILPKTENLTGSIVKNFDIRMGINGSSISLSGTSDHVTYNGLEITFENLVVKDGDNTLTIKDDSNDNDYSVSYENNVNAGTATLIITGHGYYTGNKTFEFTIDPREISDSDVTVTIPNIEYTGSSISGSESVTVKYKGVTLQEGDDKDYTYTLDADTTTVGTRAVTITGHGNFKGTRSSDTLTIADTKAPTISGTPTSESGVSREGDEIVITLTFDENITPSGTENYIVVVLNDDSKISTNEEGVFTKEFIAVLDEDASSGNQLVFKYEIKDGDYIDDGLDATITNIVGTYQDDSSNEFVFPSGETLPLKNDETRVITQSGVISEITEIINSTTLKEEEKEQEIKEIISDGDKMDALLDTSHLNPANPEDEELIELINEIKSKIIIDETNDTEKQKEEKEKMQELVSEILSDSTVTGDTDKKIIEDLTNEIEKAIEIKEKEDELKEILEKLKDDDKSSGTYEDLIKEVEKLTDEERKYIDVEIIEDIKEGYKELLEDNNIEIPSTENGKVDDVIVHDVIDNLTDHTGKTALVVVDEKTSASEINKAASELFTYEDSHPGSLNLDDEESVIKVFDFEIITKEEPHDEIPLKDNKEVSITIELPPNFEGTTVNIYVEDENGNIEVVAKDVPVTKNSESKSIATFETDKYGKYIVTSTKDEVVNVEIKEKDGKRGGTVTLAEDEHTIILSKEGTNDKADVTIYVYDDDTNQYVKKETKTVDLSKGDKTFTIPETYDGEKVYVEVEFSKTTTGGGGGGGGGGGSGGGGGGGGGGPAPVVPVVPPVVEPIQPNLQFAEGNVHKAYIKGYEDGTFNPSGTLTRTEGAIIIARLCSDFDESGDYKSSVSVYNDATPQNWYANYVGFVTSKGIMQGSDGYFRPKDPITRGELAYIIYLAFGDVISSIPDSNSLSFSDLGNQFYAGCCNTLHRKGLLNGYEDGTFKGQNYISRAEAVTMINNVLGRNNSSLEDIQSSNTFRNFPDVPSNQWYYQAVLAAANDYEDKIIEPSK